jgi:hypothetical protein
MRSSMSTFSYFNTTIDRRLPISTYFFADCILPVRLTMLPGSLVT